MARLGPSGFDFPAALLRVGLFAQRVGGEGASGLNIAHALDLRRAVNLPLAAHGDDRRPSVLTQGVEGFPQVVRA